MKYESEVRNGAALLDEWIPGWTQHIDWNQLDVADPEWCILGQVRKALSCRSIWDALDLRGWYEAVPFGFDLPLEVENEEFRDLNEAWQTWAQENGAL